VQARDYQFEQAKLAKQEQALLALEIADFEQQLAKVKGCWPTIIAGNCRD
jgi:hypothetical protein